jgi:branched-chain amino acid transport system substrate-binding protein
MRAAREERATPRMGRRGGAVTRRIVAAAAGLIMALGAWSSSGSAQAIKVGVLTARSGPGAPVGEEIYTGIQTAIAFYGPVLGRSIDLVVEDSAWNSQQAVTKATKLVQQDEVAAILGTSTVESLALLPLAERLAVPIVTSNSGGAAMTREKCNHWFFRTNPEEVMSETSLKELFASGPNLKAATWFTVGNDYGWSRMVGASAKRTPGLKYGGETYAQLDTTDWAPYIAQVRKADATAVLMPVTFGLQLVDFVQQATQFGLTREAVLIAPIGLPDWAVNKIGEPVTHVLSMGSWAAWGFEDQEPTGTARKFDETYYQLNKRVAGMQAIQAGTAALMLFNAITAAGSAKPDAIVGGLERINVPTPLGMLRFQPGGRQAEAPLFLGPYVRLSTPKYGAQFAQRVDEVVPASRSLISASDAGCHLK